MDIEILLALQRFRETVSPAVNGAFELFRMLGEPVVLMAVASVLLWGIDKRAGMFMIFNNAWGLIVNQAIKITACVYRPWIRDVRVTPLKSAIETATGYSFPSAHTTVAVATWAGIGVSFRKKLKWIMPVGIVVAALVGFSRMYVGVHTPQDVLVSAVLGAIILIASARVFEWMERNPKADAVLFVTGIAAACALSLYAAFKPYPVDYVAGELLVDPNAMINDAYKTVGVVSGFFIGWFIEGRFIRYKVDGSPLTRVVRVIIGFVVLMLLKKFLETALMVLGSELCAVFTNFALIIYATALYPLAFTKIEALLRRRA